MTLRLAVIEAKKWKQTGCFHFPMSPLTLSLLLPHLFDTNFMPIGQYLCGLSPPNTDDSWSENRGQKRRVANRSDTVATVPSCLSTASIRLICRSQNMAQDVRQVIVEFEESPETKDCLHALIADQEWSHRTDSTFAISASVASRLPFMCNTMVTL